MPTYEVYLFDETNVPVRVIPEYESIDLALARDRVSAATITLPGGVTGIGEDYRLEIYRDGLLVQDTQFLVNKVRYSWKDRLMTEIFASSAQIILDWPTITYAPGLLRSHHNDYAGNIIKDLARQNFGVDVQDAARDMSTHFSVAANANDGAIVTVDVGRARYLESIRQVASLSALGGSPLYYDVVKNTGTGKLELRTYAGQRGTDRSTEVLLSPERKTLVNPVLTQDWTNATSRAIAGGTGQELWRVEADAVNTAQVNNTPWGYIKEKFFASSVAVTQTEAGEYADYFLEANKNKMVLRGKPVNVGSKHFGRDYFLGDKISIEFLGYVAVVDISFARIKVEKNTESVDIDVIGDVI